MEPVFDFTFTYPRDSLANHQSFDIKVSIQDLRIRYELAGYECLYTNPRDTVDYLSWGLFRRLPVKSDDYQSLQNPKWKS